MNIDIEKLKENASDITKNLGKTVGKISTDTGKKITKKVEKGKGQLIKAVDQNGDNQITIEDVIIMGLKIPGIKINRSEFLKKEFSKKYTGEVVENIIKFNPAHENISLDVIDKIADDVIQYTPIADGVWKELIKIKANIKYNEYFI